LIVTKLDGSGKGGIVVAIQDELKIPTRFIGTGEKIEDFAPFGPREFVAEML
jgi:fused signal recognition particle receptor